MNEIKINKLGQYEGLEVPAIHATVSDDSIDSQIKMMLFQMAKFVTKEGAAELGDSTIIDFEGFVDGVAFEGGKGEKFALELGSGTFIPGFEPQLIGTKAGDSIDVTVTFPEAYEPSLAGKEAVFKCYVHEVQSRQIPELTDEFVATISPYKTKEEFIEYLRAEVIKEKEEFARRDWEDQLMKQICDSSEVSIPVEMIEERANVLYVNFEATLQQQGATVEMYLQANNQTEEEIKKILFDNATQMLKSHALLTVIATEQNFTVTDEEMEAELATMAAQFGLTIEQVKEKIAEHSAIDVKADILAKKGLAHVVNTAVQVEK